MWQYLITVAAWHHHVTRRSKIDNEDLWCFHLVIEKDSRRNIQETASTSSSDEKANNDKQMHNATASSLSETNRELNGNIIFLRGSKISECGHILLRTDNLKYSKNNLVLEDGNGKVGQLLVQQSDLSDGLLLHSVKRLGNGAPIFLLSGNDNGNGHILIQTSSGDDAESVSEIVEDQIQERISLRSVDGCPDEETTKSITVPLGSDLLLIEILNIGKTICLVANRALIPIKDFALIIGFKGKLLRFLIP
ncbi:hypothetical protein FQA39_LY14410 [Lamprigera yunnana]|nr:hypothetical protein FQA39_LY14410 [Lamprigera yunnana]